MKIVTGHKMLAEFDFIVIKRPGNDVKDLKAFGPRMEWLDLPQNFNFVERNLSSTEIRKRIKCSYEAYYAKDRHRVKSSTATMRPIDGLVPMGVMGFIYRTQLYKD